MTTRQRWLLVAGGFSAGVAATVLFGGLTPAPVAAQQPATPLVGRYQISAFGYSSPHGAGVFSQRGAYILDTHTGDVSVVHDDGEPKAIGSAAKPQNKK